MRSAGPAPRASTTDGDIATATKAGDILHNLQSKEQAVRDAQAVSRQAQDEGVRVMADGLGRAE